MNSFRRKRDIIAVMKVFLSISAALLALLCALLAPVSTISAHADQNDAQPQELYAVAAERDIYLYSAADEKTGLFILPYTYYVKVLSLGDPFCRVEYLDDTPPYQKVTGYCKKESLTFVDFVPARPFLRREITVTYTLPNKPTFSPSDGLLTVEVSYLFYGTYTVGSAEYFYVYGNGEFGYLPATEEITYDLNTDYLTAVSSPSGDENGQPAEKKEGLSGLQIFFLCALCVSAVAIALFVLHGKKSAFSSEREESSDF